MSIHETVRTSARNVCFLALAAFLRAVHSANLFRSTPPNWQPIASAWLIVIWGYWADRHREARR